MRDDRQARHDPPPMMMAWGLPIDDGHPSAADLAGSLLAGGAGLLLWTALALLLTLA